MDSTKFFVALILLMPVCISALAATPEPVRAEIQTLLGVLHHSGCEFNRNGSWYSSAEAHAHLQKKFDYLDGKDMVHTTEQFIDLGASTSSMSGKAYVVRCAAMKPVESKTWLLDQLATMRKKKQ